MPSPPTHRQPGCERVTTVQMRMQSASRVRLDERYSGWKQAPLGI